MSSPRMLFVNYAVDSPLATRAWFEGLGFSYNDLFCDDSVSCLVLNDQTFVMQMQRERFAGFTDSALADVRGADGQATREVLLAISAGSREEVDHLVSAAVASGGTDNHKVEDHGFMYGRSFDDIDGHTWEVTWMDAAVAAGEKTPEEFAAENG